MADVTFTPGSFFDNVDKFANSLGYQNAGIAIELAMIPWKSPEERDSFIVESTEVLRDCGPWFLYGNVC